MCPYNNNYITKDNLSTQTPKGQELLGHIKKEWKKMMVVFFLIAHEKGFKFHAQPQTGAYSCEHVNAFSFFFLRARWPCSCTATSVRKTISPLIFHSKNSSQTSGVLVTTP